VPGGELLGRADPVGKIVGQDVLEFREALPPQQRAKQLGANEYPFFGFPGWERNVAANRRLPPGYMTPPLADMTCMAHERAVFEAILMGQPYPVTAMISLASNPLLTLPNVRRTYAALKALQLYVVTDYYLTPSAALADYVFPAASTVERTALWLTPSFCLACPKGIGPLFERRDDYQFWRGLATRLGQAEHWPWQTVEEVWDYRLAPVGLTFEELLARNGLFGQREYRRYERFGFGTPSGKVELRSSTFEALACEPVPVYREPAQSPAGDVDLAREYPLVLITGSRFMPMCHSEQRQIAAARACVPNPRVSLHPGTAAALRPPHQTGQPPAALSAGGGGADGQPVRSRVAPGVSSPGFSQRRGLGHGRRGAQAGHPALHHVARPDRLRGVLSARFACRDARACSAGLTMTEGLIELPASLARGEGVRKSHHGPDTSGSNRCVVEPGHRSDASHQPGPTKEFSLTEPTTL
jgi:hypothetical protein